MSNSTTSYVHHRLTLDGLGDDIVSQYIDWLKKHAFECAMVYETHSKLGEPVRPHLHVSIYTSFSNAHYVKLFRKDFPQVKGQKMQGSHMIITPQFNDYYMFKGYKDKITNIIVQPDVRYKTSKYTSEYIQDCHIEFWKIYENTQRNLTPQPLSSMDLNQPIIIQQPKKKRAPTWLEKMPHKVEEAYPEWEWSSSIDSKARIYKVVMKELGNAVKKISPRIVREICDGIQNTLAPLDTENEYFKMVYKDEWPQITQGFFRDY